MNRTENLAAVEARIDALLSLTAPPTDPVALAEVVIDDAEELLAGWLREQGEEPTQDEVEGHRLLALGRQGGGAVPGLGDCREIVHLRNVVALYDDDATEALRRLRQQAMVLRRFGAGLERGDAPSLRRAAR